MGSKPSTGTALIKQESSILGQRDVPDDRVLDLLIYARQLHQLELNIKDKEKIAEIELRLSSSSQEPEHAVTTLDDVCEMAHTFYDTPPEYVEQALGVIMPSDQDILDLVERNNIGNTKHIKVALKRKRYSDVTNNIKQLLQLTANNLFPTYKILIKHNRRSFHLLSESRKELGSRDTTDILKVYRIEKRRGEKTKLKTFLDMLLPKKELLLKIDLRYNPRERVETQYIDSDHIFKYTAKAPGGVQIYDQIATQLREIVPSVAQEKYNIERDFILPLD
jgi:hypothetical protein